MPSVQGLEVVDLNTAHELGQLTQLADLRTFHRFWYDDAVEVDLMGMECDGIQIEPDQLIRGSLEDNRFGIIRVWEADQMPDLVGRRIGLAVTTYVPLRKFPGRAVRTTIHSSVAAGRNAAYYFPDDRTGETDYVTLPGRYSRVTVGGTALFTG